MGDAQTSAGDEGLPEEARLRKRLERIRDDVRTLRAAFDEKVGELAGKERDLAVARTKLEERERELGARATLGAELNAALAATLAPGLSNELRQSLQPIDARLAGLVDKLSETALALPSGPDPSFDARMSAIEEFARLSSDRISRLTEILTGLEQRAQKQEMLADRILSLVQKAEMQASLPPPAPRAALPAHTEEGQTRGRSRSNLLPIAALVAAVLALGVSLGVVLSGATQQGDAPTVAALPPAPAAPSRVAPSAAAAVAESAPSAAVPSAAEKSPAAMAPAAEVAPTPAPPATAEGEAAETAEEADAALDDADRKRLRRELFAALKAKKWQRAADVGAQLREGSDLDWEAAYRVGVAFHKAGRLDEAKDQYETFLAAFPTNKFAAEARQALKVIGKGL